MAIETLVGSLPDQWHISTLGDVASRTGGNIQTGPFGSQLHASDYVDTGIPSIMPKNIGNNRIELDDIARITESDAKRLQRYRVRPGDIVYSRRGDVEKRALIRDSESGWLCGTGCLRIRFGDDSVSSTYASFYLGHPKVRAWIVRHAHGATMANLNTSLLSALPFVVPPLAEQRAIAHILGTLDDKIELNRQMNGTLDEIARTLFTSWFVNFDPVRAKAEGRQPEGMDAETADLFPDRFVDSELGPIPEGWEVGSVGDIASLSKTTIKPNQHPNEIFDHYSLPSFDQGQIPAREPGSQINSNKTLVVPDSVLISKLNPHIPRVWMPQLRGDVRSICSTEFLVLTPQATYNREFLFSYLTSPRFSGGFQARVTGTTGSHQRVSADSLMSIGIPLPPRELIDRFRIASSDVLELIGRHREESLLLAETRDTLLPELLSGRVRSGETRAVVGEAVGNERTYQCSAIRSDAKQQLEH